MGNIENLLGQYVDRGRKTKAMKTLIDAYAKPDQNLVDQAQAMDDIGMPLPPEAAAQLKKAEDYKLLKQSMHGMGLEEVTALVQGHKDFLDEQSRQQKDKLIQAQIQDYLAQAQERKQIGLQREEQMKMDESTGQALQNAYANYVQPPGGVGPSMAENNGLPPLGPRDSMIANILNSPGIGGRSAVGVIKNLKNILPEQAPEVKIQKTPGGAEVVTYGDKVHVSPPIQVEKPPDVYDGPNGSSLVRNPKGGWTVIKPSPSDKAAPEGRKIGELWDPVDAVTGEKIPGFKETFDGVHTHLIPVKSPKDTSMQDLLRYKNTALGYLKAIPSLDENGQRAARKSLRELQDMYDKGAEAITKRSGTPIEPFPKEPTQGMGNLRAQVDNQPPTLVEPKVTPSEAGFMSTDEPPATARVKITSPDGKAYTLPAHQLDRFLKKHPDYKRAP